ncbi:efflux RND transporter periplasmic adaptor subunit [Desertivirga xinjiangensis]|uniref:efflux RND transporter periplasmic adaptor subunit n=1 Tax=Desertivirga xinjiangensis TaxID=539206 RepID=UPI002108C955|nr:efflux RND transporter periplasmic adaptor subunit [Pedobacter xinjiangensis]
MKHVYSIYLITIALLIYSCRQSETKQGPAPGAVKLPVYTVSAENSFTSQEFPVKLEGHADIEIRSLVDGYLQKIYADEGDYVSAGRALFKIEDHRYREALNIANGQLTAASAAAVSAQLEIEKLTPLVVEGVVSDYQLKTATAALEIAKGNKKQAEAAVEAAKINLGYTIICAPVNGFITRLPKKQGSLVSANSMEPLTILSDNKTVYAYLTLSEQDFSTFKEQYTGNTLKDKIKKVPPVTLVLSGNKEYQHKGHIDMVDGRVDKSTGAITLRATFPNHNGLLRSGNTGRVKISIPTMESLLVPQEATVEEQGKVYVYKLDKAGKVEKSLISINGKTETAYLVSGGVQDGDLVVYKGFEGLQDGTLITPEKVN